MSMYDYDVALSFAAEQRDFVSRVYSALRSNGFAVFYDEGEVSALWGQDLYQRLTDVYSNRAAYCVVFLSKEYGAKLWTRHELKAAQARAFRSADEEYLLPARFDDTEIPGLLPTIAYVSLAKHTPDSFAAIVMSKLARGGAMRGSERKKQADTQARLASAVIYAEDYLQPGSLAISDQIAAELRREFGRELTAVEREHVLPYLRQHKAPFRVAGYIALQVAPRLASALDIAAALRLEQKEAEVRKETRPLWQLLLVTGTFLAEEATGRDLVLCSLYELLVWLNSRQDVDLGGECKRRIELLIG